MQEYVEECIEVFDEEMKKSITPAKHNLFEVNEDEKMSEARMEVFNHIVANLLYVFKQVRVDIDLAVSFLCIGVSRSTEEDWGKLRRLLHYLWDTIDIPMIIGANGLELIET